MNNTTADIVNNQYEQYPYPHRNPENEKNHFIATHMDDLNALNSIAFKGKKRFENFRALVAGGGTGDAIIFLAEQLRYFPDAEIIYCDLSRASMKVAQSRAEVRKLTNITWWNKSFLDIDKTINQFDFINCCGVLHHLEDPDFGLRSLKELLKPDGVMSIMVYAQIGRTGIYHTQDLMRLISNKKHDLINKVNITKQILSQSPKTNWWNHSKNFVSDVQTGGDAGIVDLFLHAQDRAYTIEELYTFIEGSGLTLIDFAMPDRYNLLPEAHGITGNLLRLIQQHSQKKQQSIIELIAGNIMQHTCYLSKTTDTRAKISNHSNIPYFHHVEVDVKAMASMIENKAYKSITMTIAQKYKSVITVGKYTTEILRNIDGSKTLEEIYSAVKLKYKNNVDISELETDFKSLYKALNKYDAMLLRNQISEKVPTPAEIQRSFVNSI